MARTRILVLSVLVLVLTLAGFPPEQAADDYGRVLAAFRSPSAEYRSAPLWVWNDRMTREEVETQLRDFRGHGIGGVFIHPRPGLITPYLSPEWLSLCRWAVDTGKKLGMKVWLYDEDSYSSGFAGGHVPAEMPDAVLSGLRMKKFDRIPETMDEKPLVILRRTGEGWAVVSPPEASALGAGEYAVFDVVRSKPNPWYAGYTYVDLMRRDVTEKFLEITLDAYKKAIGQDFGGVVPGVFQDEADIAPAGGEDAVNYTPSLFDAFQAKWGYDLRPRLMSLFSETGDWRQVRHNYYGLLLELFIENWAKPYYDYCTRNRLALTGHYWDHEWPTPRLCPDSMGLSAYAHVPGIDILMNVYQTDPHAQFGNARAVREVRSVANQLGRRRILSETYGASGWDLSFLDQKRIGDWEYALGVNLLNQHLSYATIKGARKRDHPLSFSYHEPWWPAYGLMADYFGRLSAALSAGRQENRVLVLEPTTSAWMYYTPGRTASRSEEIGRTFQDFVNELEARQVEYDLASEVILRDSAKIEPARIRVGLAAYEVIVLPPGLENLDRETERLLETYLSQGGRILSFVPPPAYLDGRPDDALARASATFKDRWVSTNPAAGFDILSGLGLQDVIFDRSIRSPGALFHHHRRLQDADLVFLCNVSPSEDTSGRFVGPGDFVERWDPADGTVSAYPGIPNQRGVAVAFDLPPGGSMLLCLRKGTPSQKPRAEEWVKFEEIRPSTALAARAVAPNVLTLDYCDLVLDGREDKDLYFYEAQQKAFRRYGFTRNPWDNAVQYKMEILDKDHFAPGTGFEAVFWFDVADGVPLESLQAVVEQPRLFRVSLNGRPLKPLEGRWWLDRAFGVFPLGREAKPGRNRLSVTVSPFSVLAELEPVYILGDFSLVTVDKGFRIVPPLPMGLGSWKTQGRPFYAAGVRYEKTFPLPAFDPKKERLILRLGQWKGALTEVFVDGRSAGYVAFPPYEIELGGRLTAGEHRVGVLVYGTLKNTLGPHHDNPPRGQAWPGSFQKGDPSGYPPGSAYDLQDYGLLQDFTVEKRIRKE